MLKPSHKQSAEIGNRVVFESDRGPQVGTLINIVRDVGNAQPFAIVAVDDRLSGFLASVPVADLQSI